MSRSISAVTCIIIVSAISLLMILLPWLKEITSILGILAIIGIIGSMATWVSLMRNHLLTSMSLDSGRVCFRYSTRFPCCRQLAGPRTSLHQPSHSLQPIDVDLGRLTLFGVLSRLGQR